MALEVRQQGWVGPMPWEIAGTTDPLPPITDGLIKIAGIEMVGTEATPTGVIFIRPSLAEIKRLPTPLRQRDIHVVDMPLLKTILEPMIFEVLHREDTSYFQEKNIGERLADAMMRFPVPQDGILTAEHDRKAFTEIGKYFPSAVRYIECMDAITKNSGAYWGDTSESFVLAYEWRQAAKQLGATLYGEQWDALRYYR